MAQAFSAQETAQQHQQPIVTGGAVDYTICTLTTLTNVLVFVGGGLAAAGAVFLFYKSGLVSLIGGLLVAPFIVRLNKKNSIKKRQFALRGQFRDMLEAMNVSMRAGSNEVKALQSAYSDLQLVYPGESDIVCEVGNMLNLYNNGLPLRELFRDFANRSALEDVNSFASIFEAIEGKSDRATDVIRQTQKVIADKIEIEMEIETMITSTKSEQNVMFCMPLVIVATMGFMGEGFMDAIYTTALGRVIATVTIIIFIAAFMLSNKITNIKI